MIVSSSIHRNRNGVFGREMACNIIRAHNDQYHSESTTYLPHHVAEGRLQAVQFINRDIASRHEASRGVWGANSHTEEAYGTHDSHTNGIASISKAYTAPSRPGTNYLAGVNNHTGVLQHPSSLQTIDRSLYKPLNVAPMHKKQLTMRRGQRDLLINTRIEEYPTVRNSPHIAISELTHCRQPVSDDPAQGRMVRSLIPVNDREEDMLARRISELEEEVVRLLLLMDRKEVLKREARFREEVRAEEKAKAEHMFCFAARVARGEGRAWL